MPVEVERLLDEEAKVAREFNAVALPHRHEIQQDGSDLRRGGEEARESGGDGRGTRAQWQ